MPKIARYRKAKNAAKFFSDLDAGLFTESIGPGFAGYAATRLSSRIVYTLAKKRFPGASRHVAVASGLLAAGAVYLFGKKVKAIAKFQEPILVGAGIAAVQGIAQTYIPKYGWIVGDYTAALEEKQQAAMPESVSDYELEKMLEEAGLEEVPLTLPAASDEEQTDAEIENLELGDFDLGDDE